MKSFIFVITILLVAVNGYIDEWNLIQPKKFDSEIYDCMEYNNDLWNELRNYIDVVRWRDYFLNNFLQRFSWRTLHIEYVNRTLTDILNELVSINQLGIDRAGQVRLAIINALLNCTDNGSFGSQNRSTGQSNFHDLPNFHFELSRLTNLLNLILVDSENLLEQTNGLATLSNFARNGLRLLEETVEYSFSFVQLFTLRQIWRGRADIFYDFANEIPYIRHAYSMDFPTVYTHDDPDLFNTRIRTDYDIRNAPASRDDISRVLSFHPRDRNSHNLNRFYSLQHRLAMTQADVYYEIHENRFFRVLFFFLELVDRGYADFDGNVLTNQSIPEDLLQLLHKDTYYGYYLETAMERELNSLRGRRLLNANKFIGSLRQHNRILEPDVIMLFILRIRSSVTTTAIPMSTTIASDGASSTLRSEDFNKISNITLVLPKKDSSTSREKNNVMNTNNYYFYDPGPSCSQNHQNFQCQKKQTSRNYGYIADQVNSKEEKTLSGHLQNIISTMVINKIPI